MATLWVIKLGKFSGRIRTLRLSLIQTADFCCSVRTVKQQQQKPLPVSCWLAHAAALLRTPSTLHPPTNTLSFTSTSVTQQRQVLALAPIWPTTDMLGVRGGLFRLLVSNQRLHPALHTRSCDLTRGCRSQLSFSSSSTLIIQRQLNCLDFNSNSIKNN